MRSQILIRKKYWKDNKMKQLITSIVITFLIGSGFAQSKISDDKKNATTKDGPRIEQVEIERDYFSDMQPSEQKKKDVLDSQQEKTAVVKDMEKSNSHSKIYSTENVKPNQIIRFNEAINFGQGKDQFHSQKKSRKKINSVEGMAPRENIKKIEGHAPVSEEILIQALSQPKPVKATLIKSK